MGRFSSVQAYADSNSAIRKVPYEQAAASDKGGDAKGIQAHVKPEKVVNPYGSTAGAGSGEFHVYRHGRNREMQRIRRMDRESRVQEANEKFQKELDDNEQWAEDRTDKRRRKREKQKEAKRRKQNLKKSGIAVSDQDDLVNQEVVDDEFTYVPGAAMAPLEELEKEEESKPLGKPNDADEKPEFSPPKEASSIPNDGSFLELMSKQLKGAEKVNEPKEAPASET